MIPFKSPLLLTVPPTLEKRLEALAALRTLLAQDEELVRQRRAAIAAVRRDLEQMQREVGAIRPQLVAEVRADVLRMLKYSPDQPRVPKGSSHGGEWTSEDESGSSPDSMARPLADEHPAPGRGLQYAALETGTQTDASHAPNGGGSSGGAEPDGDTTSHGESERGPQYAQLQAGTPTGATEGAPRAVISVAAPNQTTVIYTYSDGSRDVYSGGSISWRNNNPGNMVAGAGGISPIGRNGGFAIFPDYQTGFDAVVANLERPGYQAVTIGDAIRLWAPEAAGNNPVTYANHIQTWTGLPVDMPMDVLTTAQINAVASAIQRQEGWVVGTVTHIPPPPHQ
jgi:hypothetical protein